MKKHGIQWLAYRLHKVFNHRGFSLCAYVIRKDRQRRRHKEIRPQQQQQQQERQLKRQHLQPMPYHLHTVNFSQRTNDANCFIISALNTTHQQRINFVNENVHAKEISLFRHTEVIMRMSRNRNNVPFVRTLCQ